MRGIRCVIVAIIVALFIGCLLSLGCSGFKCGTQRVIGEMTLTRLEELQAENGQLRTQLQQAALQIQNTQKLLAALSFPPPAAKAFRRLGWQIKEQEVQAPAVEKK